MPIIDYKKKFNQAVKVMNEKKLGIVVITKKKFISGLITDGDLRRFMGNGILEKKVSQIMTKKPITVDENIFAIEALNLMKKNKITQVFVTKNNKPIGILHIHDCIELELA